MPANLADKNKVIPKYSIDDLCTLMGMAKITIYRIRKRDATFPAPLTEKPLTWIASHIDAWIENHNKLHVA